MFFWRSVLELNVLFRTALELSCVMSRLCARENISVFPLIVVPLVSWILRAFSALFTVLELMVVLFRCVIWIPALFPETPLPTFLMILEVTVHDPSVQSGTLAFLIAAHPENAPVQTLEISFIHTLVWPLKTIAPCMRFVKVLFWIILLIHPRLIPSEICTAFSLIPAILLFEKFTHTLLPLNA